MKNQSCPFGQDFCYALKQKIKKASAHFVICWSFLP